MHLVLVRQIHIAFKESDLDVCPADVALRVGVKQQHGGAFQMVALHEMQLFQQGSVGLLQHLRQQTLALQRQRAELPQHPGIEIGHADIRHRHTVPMQPLFL